LADASTDPTAGTANTRRLSLGNRPNAEHCGSRVVHLALPNLLSEPCERDLRASPKRRPRRPLPRFFVAPPEHSLRGRNTQDGRVRNGTTRDRLYLSGTRSLTHRRGALHTGHAERVVRLTAGHLRRRHREKQTENRLTALPTRYAKTLFADPFAPALTYKEKPLY
jgi:hypothetical protein